tara:strand:+ start:346 stop:582 length:237 start_codon:yes stop_codon:yes gene_type:complete
MKDRTINLKVSNITPKQWSSLVIELNLVADSWRPYGPQIKLKTRDLDKIIRWGRSKHENIKKGKRSHSIMGPTEESEI